MSYNDNLNDPDFWKSFAETIGNPVPEIEDDSEFVDENGVVIKEGRLKSNKEESKYQNSIQPVIQFFVDKESREVAAIHMYSIFGIFTMDQSIQDWRPSSREDESVSNFIYGTHDIYDYNWGSEPYSVSDPNWDPEDLQDWYPKVSKSWARGETVTEADLAPYARKIESNFLPEVPDSDLPDY